MNTTTTMTQPAVYVGTYHKYNCGSIAGAWLTLTDYDDEASFYAACRALHANEPDPELMFQDIEGIPDAFASECSVDWSFVEGFREASEAGKAGAYVVWTELTGRTDFDEFDDVYLGETTCEEAYAMHYVEEHGLLDGMPEDMRDYFDYSAYGRDLFLNGLTLADGYVFGA
ncbi:antirestriction protein ArdA [Klebsiella sp. PL-2018]|uniref:antirestriction protein ArdA n=1 Tax=Klebsiella TaxID=570 RepID=UPI001C22F73A|nr:antirestriction protein ArdA [Klebsiella sp. PL-2018]QXD01022.1 Antirestriction protein ArdA [Klebsiella sp. PL-2018]